MSLYGKILAAMLVAGQALAAPVQCPPSLEVAQRATAVPVGMQAFDAGPMHNWTNAALSDGPPNEQAWLAPDDTSQKGLAFTNRWTFAPTPDGIWLSCRYIGTSVILSFRLPTATKACSVHYDATISPPAATAIDCR